MNCEDVIERIENTGMHSLSDIERQSCIDHVSSCDACDNALRGARALRLVRDQANKSAPGDLFDRVVSSVTHTGNQTPTRTSFWLGAGFGGAIAAALVFAAMTLGVLDRENGELPDTAEFVVSMNETREISVAIDAERALPGATLKVLLPDGVELAGYGDRRELSWSEDLVFGVNKLTLPLQAVDNSGGQLIVQVDHEDKRLTLRVHLRVDS